MYEPYNNIIFNIKCDNGEYLAYELAYLSNETNYLQYILPVLREEYGFGSQIDDKLENLSEDKKIMLRRIMARYNTPDPENNVQGRGRQLKTTRGKIGEVIAKDFLKTKDMVEFSGRISLEEEDSDMPKKGIDNFGFIFKETQDNIILDRVVVCEVKASDSQASPPAVVHTNEDSMYKELIQLKNFNTRMMKALVKSFDRFNKEKYCEVISELLLAIEQSDDLTTFQSKVMVVPFLLRTKNTYTQKDFGKFVSHASEFGSTTIKYYIVIIDLPIEEFADRIYGKLREEG